MKSPSALQELVQALRCLPGVGPRAAQRMAFHLLQHDRPGTALLSRALNQALDQVRHCVRCNNFSQDESCEICTAENRDQTLLCVLETPADLLMMEQTRAYQGLYFVLMGKISPLDGMGPQDIALEALRARALDGKTHEVILATNFTAEGEATAHAIYEMLKTHPLAITRIARGLPVGGELEYVDSGTLAQALVERRSNG